MKFGVVYWLNVVFLLVFALIFYTLQKFVRFKDRIIIVSIVLIIAISGLLLSSGKNFIMELFAGLAVIGGKDPWLNSISELRSMLFPEGNLNLLHATETLTLLYWFFPFILVNVFIKWRRNGYKEFRLCLFLVWGLVFWILPLFRERYVHLTAVTTAIGGGFVFLTIKEHVANLWRETLPPLFAAGVLLFLLMPATSFIWRIPDMGLSDFERNDLPVALKWLRERTPQTSYFDNPVHVPEYGVLSNWGLGAYINYLGQRPTVATNFGWETHGLIESAAYLTLTDPFAAGKILQTNRVRYLFLNQMSGGLQGLRDIASFGLMKGAYQVVDLTPFKPVETMYYRLYIQDASSYDVGSRKVEALRNYRLVYESTNGFKDSVAGFVSHYKIFEYVEGALVKGQSAAGQKIEIQIRLKSHTGRVFLYRNTIVSGNDGTFLLRVPYATDKSSGDIVPQGPYLLSFDGRSIAINVKESEVYAGETVNIL